MPESRGEIIVIGVGGHARVVASLALASGYQIAGFLHDGPGPAPAKPILGRPLLGDLEVLRALPRPLVALGVGDNHHRLGLLEAARRVNPACQFPSLIHPTASVDPSAVLGVAVQICAGAIICVEAHLGEGALINTGATIDHEVVLERYCHISPGANLAGRVTVGEFTHIGTGAAVIPGVRIGTNVIVGAGAAVVRNLPDGVTAVGVPARVIKAS